LALLRDDVARETTWVTDTSATLYGVNEFIQSLPLEHNTLRFGPSQATCQEKNEKKLKNGLRRGCLIEVFSLLFSKGKGKTFLFLNIERAERQPAAGQGFP
jgi:hypothetical protein